MRKIVKARCLIVAWWSLSLACGLATAQDKQPTTSRGYLEGAEPMYLGPPDRMLYPVAPELKKAAEDVVKALGNKEIDKAYAVMTNEGADQFMGKMLLKAKLMAQSTGAEADNEKADLLKRKLAHYGLDKVQIEPLSRSATEAEQVGNKKIQASEAAGSNLLAQIPERDRRQVTREILEASEQAYVPPVSLSLVEFRIDARSEVVVATVNQDTTAQDAAKKASLSKRTFHHLVFRKVEGTWKFVGFH